ncbi:hypothetical protein QJS10_CPB18g00099 [Acorus calamus]|uniref:CREG-like beta-barrel domain-containing protein n=1 Tax=Acorus calamus TaxID=4465 RepID=A0AAV9CJR3_ACOCL|nr:hypothetical protein QJS10_CPB18g00099 [Acorus calamus]
MSPVGRVSVSVPVRTARIRAMAREVSDGGEEKGGPSGNGLGFGLVVPDVRLFEVRSRVVISDPFVLSWAGLFRTPISGGIQSATSAHDLPRPALAVRNLMEQIPGWSGLSNARVTIFGDILPVPADLQEWACKRYITKHQQWASQQWGNFYYYRMQNISDIYFIGGFGTVAWVDVKEYESLQPDKIAVDGGEQYLKELNAIFSKPLKEFLSSETEFNIQRLSFEVGHGVETLEEAKAALQKIINRDCRSRSHPRT